MPRTADKVQLQTDLTPAQAEQLAAAVAASGLHKSEFVRRALLELCQRYGVALEAWGVGEVEQPPTN